ncbi:MAG: response regulator transcription factor [Lachnospiraceae bacterium]|nr:response regulator transcription factor [Lachnospiraceae bacterium]
MKIAICDDESVIREQLQQMVIRQKPDSEICLFASGKQLLEAEESFDIILLDIQMKEINGLETARALRSRCTDTVLIFITALKEYVYEAFDVSAFHYLLKPVRKEKFAEVFDRAVKEIEKQEEQRERRIFIKTRNRHVTIPAQDIYYIESQKRKVIIHTRQEILEIYGTMNEMEKQLGEGFYRCHRGYLVNMAYITEYSADSIQINTREEIYMAKDKYQGFVKAYLRYLRRGGVSGV